MELAEPVVVEQVIADGGTITIIPPVVVIIPDGHAHAINTHIQPRTGCHVREMSVAVVMVKGRGCRRRCRQRATANRSN